MRFELLRQNGTLGLVRCVVRDGRAGTGNRGAPQTTGRRRCLSRGTKKTVQHGTLPDTRADTDTDTADRRTHTSAAHDDTDCIAHATGALAFTPHAVADPAPDALADSRADSRTDAEANTGATAVRACAVVGVGGLQRCVRRGGTSTHARPRAGSAQRVAACGRRLLCTVGQFTRALAAASMHRRRGRAMPG